MVILEQVIREMRFIADNYKNGEFIFLAYIIKWFHKSIAKSMDEKELLRRKREDESEFLRERQEKNKKEVEDIF
mgnify:CR=1 FL=1